MQLDVLSELCGPEVEVFDEENIAELPPAWETVLLLDFDDTQHFVTLAGPPGSFNRLLRVLEAEPGLAAGEEGGWQICRY